MCVCVSTANCFQKSYCKICIQSLHNVKCRYMNKDQRTFLANSDFIYQTDESQTMLPCHPLFHFIKKTY